MYTHVTMCRCATPHEFGPLHSDTVRFFAQRLFIFRSAKCASNQEKTTAEDAAERTSFEIPKRRDGKMTRCQAFGEIVRAPSVRSSAAWYPSPCLAWFIVAWHANNGLLPASLLAAQKRTRIHTRFHFNFSSHKIICIWWREDARIPRDVRPVSSQLRSHRAADMQNCCRRDSAE